MRSRLRESEWIPWIGIDPASGSVPGGIRMSDRKSAGTKLLARLVRYDNRILGTVLLVIAIDNWVHLANRTDDLAVYLENGFYAIPTLNLLAIGFSALYLTIVSWIMLRSAEPLARCQTLLPNLMAVVGGFGVYAFGILQPAETPLMPVAIPLALLVAGPALVLYALRYLGRAFTVTPQARFLVVAGPYRIVRHPMYVGNILSIVGLGLLLATPESILLALLCCGLQTCRAHYEERLLMSTFVEYRGYMQTVGAFLPRFRACRRGLTVIGLSMLCGLLGPQPAMARDAKAEAKCKAWHQKALSGQWFTKQEGEEFAATETMQESMASIPACRDFFKLQSRCQGAWIDEQIGESSTAILDAVDNIPGCKSILGLANICGALEATRQKKVGMSPGHKALLKQCLDRSIVQGSSEFLRPAL